MHKTHQCLECGHSISSGVHDYSTDFFGIPLCLKHQNWLAQSTASKEAIKLYFALKSGGVPAVLEGSDGNKTVDIAIPGKLYIEVNGIGDQEPDEALTEVFQSIHSSKDSIPTLKISIEQVWNSYSLDIIVDRLTEMTKDFKKTG